MKPAGTQPRAGAYRIFRWLALVIAASAVWLRAQEPPAHVLVVHSYHQGMSWADGVSHGLQERLRDRAELVYLYLDVKRFPDPAREPEMEAELAACVARCRPRLVVVVDDFAERFVRERRARMFPSCPVVFCGVNFAVEPREKGFGGVVESIDIAATLRLAWALQPQVQRLVVVNDRTETGMANRQAFEAAQAEAGGRTVLFLGGTGSFADTEQRLGELDPQKDAVLLLSWNRDGTGAVRPYETAIARARSSTRAAIYGVWGFYFGQGLVGGSLIDGYTHGSEAAEIVEQVLQGRPIDDIPVVERCRTRAVVDGRELHHFNIPRARVPDGVEVTHDERSLWAENRGVILAVAAVMVFQGLTIGLLVVALERRKRAEARLEASKEQLRLTLESSSDAVVATDVRAGVVLINSVAAQLFGRSPAEARGRPLWEVVDLRDLTSEAPFQPSVHVAVLRDHETRSAVPASLRRSGGDRRLVSYSAAPIRDADGVTLGMVLSVRDITVQHQLEEQLRQSQKLESVGLLAGGVAHDFNNVLQVIEGNLALLADAPGLTAEHQELTGEIRRAATRAGGLTRQLLAFGRRQQLVSRDLDLAELVDGMLSMLRRLIRVDVSLNFSAPRGVFWVRADAGQLEQVLLNLCLNARDAMPRGGEIAIGLKHEALAPVPRAGAAPEPAASHVVLTIADQGVGMDRETLARVFEPFFTTKPAGQGTGLGLSVVQGIVQQHGGRVQVESTPQVGTSFRILLPAVSAPTAPAGGTCDPETASPSVAFSGNLLLADDDEAVRKSVGAWLRQRGFAVSEVGDGEAACEFVAQFAERLHAVILDVAMPRMGGPAAAAHISRLRPGVPIVLCSGFLGAVSSTAEIDPQWRWLQKPFRPEELLGKLDEATKSRRDPSR